MASLKVFVSSTCYDLGIVRSKLQEFLRSLGYEPILSEFSDVLFDPRTHTHTSCVDEVANCDVMVLLIGSRYGGKAVPEALSRVDLGSLSMTSSSTWVLESGRSLSITQLEVLRALESKIPVFSFVEDKVMHDHLVYEKNKESEFLDQLVFPSIDQQDAAKYIFEFINFLRLKSAGNALATFGRIDDIEFHLRKQWSALLQRLLAEQRNRSARQARARSIQEQLEDLKTALLTTIETPDARAIARGVIRYRLLIDFAVSVMGEKRASLKSSELTWESLMEARSIKKVVRVLTEDETRFGRPRTFLVAENGSFLAMRLSFERLQSLYAEIESFSQLAKDVRAAIVDAWLENAGPTGRLLTPSRHSTFESYLEQLERPATIESYDISDLGTPQKRYELEPRQEIEKIKVTPSFDEDDDDIPF